MGGGGTGGGGAGGGGQGGDNGGGGGLAGVPIGTAGECIGMADVVLHVSETAYDNAPANAYTFKVTGMPF